jgi:peptidoglycan/xylan/chitin deacetylase (PgdA/CDA1 family)
MKQLDVNLNGICLCISVDDVPVHGPGSPSYSRLDVVRNFTDALSKHQIAGVYGFVNGASTEPALITKTLRKMATFKTTRKFVNVSAKLKFDLSCYMKPQITDTSHDYEQLLQHWVDQRHHLANHNYWHSDLNSTDIDLFIAGIQRNQKLLSKFPTPPTKLFRYPYLKEGETATKRDALRNYLAANNYKIAPVTVNFNDWAWNKNFVRHSKNGFSSINRDSFVDNYIDIAVLSLKGAVLASRNLFGRDIKHILLLHMGVFTALTLGKLLSTFRRLGVSFITMEEALQDSVFDKTLDIIVEGRGRNLLEQQLLAGNEPDNGVLSFAMRSHSNNGTTDISCRRAPPGGHE